MTNTIISLWFLAFGLVGIVRPTFFFRSEKLTREKIERNIRIWRWGGGGLVVCGVAGLVIELLRD